SWAAPGEYVARSAELSETRDDESLLDRLLDEADALRDVKAVLDSDAGQAQLDRAPKQQASAPKGRLPVTSQPASVESSVLRQNADATRRAFSRADALVSLAQGYLRSDRPNRSPIEVVVTIPASSLRSSELDPVEVGEIGESLVSVEAARRLSCDAGVVEI